MRAPAPITVVEVDPFPARAARIWSAAEHEAFVDFIARSPEAGDLIPGAGGLRKVRWTRPGSGKRGGSRVIYFFYERAFPVFLLAVYSKSERADLSAADRAQLAKLAATLKDNLKTRRRRQRAVP